MLTQVSAQPPLLSAHSLISEGGKHGNWYPPHPESEPTSTGSLVRVEVEATHAAAGETPWGVGAALLAVVHATIALVYFSANQSVVERLKTISAAAGEAALSVNTEIWAVIHSQHTLIHI